MDKPIVITFGRYVYPEPYHRIHLEITETFDKAEISREDASAQLREYVNGVLEEELFRYKPTGEPAKAKHTPPAPVEEKVEAPAQEEEALPYRFPGLEKAPWTSYKTKGPCRAGEAGWIFSDTDPAQDVADLISRDGPVKVIMDDVVFTCKFSGPTENPTRFISRNPPRANGGRR